MPSTQNVEPVTAEPSGSLGDFKLKVTNHLTDDIVFTHDSAFTWYAEMRHGDKVFGVHPFQTDLAANIIEVVKPGESVEIKSSFFDLVKAWGPAEAFRLRLDYHRKNFTTPTESIWSSWYCWQN